MASPTAFSVHLCADAETDLEGVRDHAAAVDSPEAADALLARIEEAVLSLAVQPQQGARPPELERVGVAEYREVIVRPYRAIYRVCGRDVFVHCILDGRRDLQDLLLARLLR